MDLKLTEEVIREFGLIGRDNIISKYWNGEGKYQKTFEKIWDYYVPLTGECKDTLIEALRSLNRIGYDKYNNGNCNFEMGKTDDYFSICNDNVSKIFPELQIREYIGLFDGDEIDMYMNEIIEYIAKEFKYELK